MSHTSRRLLQGLLFVASCALAAAPALAADPGQGKAIAERWCASCHLVGPKQINATDLAPPFAYLARTPDFDQNKLAFLLLAPHPNMPKVSLNRAETADLAAYMLTLK